MPPMIAAIFPAVTCPNIENTTITLPTFTAGNALKIGSSSSSSPDIFTRILAMQCYEELSALQ
jgi:hypothetical protein